MARRRNLRRKWIWIGLGTAGAVAATVLVVRHYRGGAQGGEGGGGTGGGFVPGIDQSLPYASALARLCTAPESLTVADREILISNVFAPAWQQFVAQHGDPQAKGPAALTTALRTIALRVLKRACGFPSGSSTKQAVGLADGGRMFAEGSSEQG
jgi:hypothetical protein